MLEGAKYIKEVPFSSLFNWSVQYLNETKISFNSSYPMVSIGSFLTRNKTSINIENGVTYKRVTIKVRNGGVVQRDSEIGDNIGTKRQYKVSEGQFILSKIDARNGAMGLIPSELEGAIVTQDFLPYDLDITKINPQYLVLVSTTKEFVAFCQTCSSGTTNRQRVDEAKFLDIKIPLPTIEEQNKLVADYNKKMALAAKQESQALTKEQEIEEYIFDKLGVTYSNQANTSGLKFVAFKDILRWDCYNTKESYESTRFSNITMGQLVIGKPKYGAAYKSKKRCDDIRYIRITDINENGTLNDDFVSAEGFEEQYLLKQNDFLIARSGNTVGKTFLYDISYGRAIFAGYLIKFVFDQQKVDLNYLLAYTKSGIYKHWINSNMRVSAQPNINSQQYLESPIILPPIEIQKEIATHISGLKQEIKKLRTTAESNRKAALANFEQKIF